ncbi:MAG: phosphoribosylamine--glycine ligase [Chloroflexi bacterium]|nr:phosphoribosylamine--glycine ligase [Chloroflexota bacterium]
MRVLVVGSGAREHAICWKLRQSPRLSALFCAPGNAGIATVADLLPIPSDDVDSLVAWSEAQRTDLVVVGPEAPLALGLVDALQARGLLVFGPTREAAMIESSKRWAWELMERHRIPAPASVAVSEVEEGIQAVLNLVGLPVAIKADGLAAGKGVVIAERPEEAAQTLQWLIEERGLGEAGRTVLLQELLRGPELSLLAFSDGTTVVPMLPARDFKRAEDGDQGPNTGGMGAYAPPSFATRRLVDRITREVLEPTVAAMALEGRPFRGVLYAGIMLTDAGPKVLEFNCRFGDPETQVLLPLLESDLLEILLACARGELDPQSVRWSSRVACGVSLVSGGYPGRYHTGLPISGLDTLASDTVIFHAGTATRSGGVVTAGGRVLTAVGVGRSLLPARAAAYNVAKRVSFEGCYYRSDIAADDAAVARALGSYD